MSGLKPGLRVGLLYGGRSPEHEVSRMSARDVLRQLDPARYEVVPIAIDAAGRWFLQEAEALRHANGATLPIDTAGQELSIRPRPGGQVLPALGDAQLDVVLPMLHGPLCEDGALQGLLELCDLPYVGAGVLGSALCMDKAMAKAVVSAAGIACAPHVTLHASQWPARRDRIAAEVAAGPGLPAFVKPANMGSSVGIRRAGDADALRDAIEHALRYDAWVLIERAIDAREIELAVLSPADLQGPPGVSVPGEITPVDAFYDYERKYLDEAGARLQVPAALMTEQVEVARTIARRVFELLRCEGMARIDLFLERGTGRFLFNEANTLPGFTPYSMFPALWEASGLRYPALLDRLIEHALRRHGARRDLLHTRV